MLHEIIPHYSCVVSAEELEAAKTTGYSEIYVVNGGEYFKYNKLSGGRSVQLKIDKLPASVKVPGLDLVVKEELNFLPAGKIPFEFWEQIVFFFRQVIALKKSNIEAHAYILWEESKGYYIHIPKQTVGAASVSFVYDIPQGSVIVVDVHSHNSMGAFWSGTDNNNDAMGIYYSGVVGKITDKSYDWVMRFNLTEHKRVCTLEEVFEMPKKEIVIPAEWLDQVEITKTGYQGYQGGYHGNWQGGSQEWKNGKRVPYNPKFGTKATGDGSSVRKFSPENKPTQAGLYDNQYDEMELMRLAYMGLGNTHDSVDNQSSTLRLLDSNGKLIVLDEDDPVGEVRKRRTDHITPIRMNQNGEGLEQPKKAESQSVTSSRNERAEGSEFDYNASQFGSKVAEAKDQIDTWLPDLEEKDELLRDLLARIFSMMTKETQISIQTNGLPN